MSETTSTPSFPLRDTLVRTVGLLLLLFPVGVSPLGFTTRIILTAFLCSVLTLGLQIQMLHFFRPPRWLRWILLPALICAPPFSLISLPEDVNVLIPLFALSWVLGTPSLRIAVWSRVLILFLFAWRTLSLAEDLPVFDFPRFPSATPIWISIALIIPLGLATQQRLRPFAKGLLLLMGCVAYLAASLIPLVLQGATGHKEIGEPELDFYSLEPLPGFQVATTYTEADVLPEMLRDFEDPLLAVEILDTMNLRLQPSSLIFSDPPNDQDLFLLQQGGFLLKDRFGFFVPASVYGTPELPEHMSPRILPMVAELADRTSFPSSEQTRPTLLRLRNLNLMDTIPGDSSRFRLTPQARRPFANGYFPRQVLFAVQHQDPASPGRIHHALYAPRWELSFDRTRQELISLVDKGILDIDDTAFWHSPAYDQIVFPPAEVPKGLAFPVVGMLLLVFAGKLSRNHLIAIGCFSSAMVLQFATPFAPSPDLPLVIQAVWTTVWLPFSLILISLAFGLRHKEARRTQRDIT